MRALARQEAGGRFEVGFWDGSARFEEVVWLLGGGVGVGLLPEEAVEFGLLGAALGFGGFGGGFGGRGVDGVLGMWVRWGREDGWVDGCAMRGGGLRLLRLPSHRPMRQEATF